MKVCIVGYGRMGKNHERVLRELGHEVVTTDSDLKSGAEFKTRSLLFHPFDAACIATPIDVLGYEATVALSGCDVLVEKPGCFDQVNLGLLHWQAEKAKRKLIVGYTERHNPAVQALKENLHRVGVIQHISARRLGYAFDRAGDPALDLATHDLDVLDFLGFSHPRLRLRDFARSEHHVSALLDYGTTTVSIEASHLHPIKVRELEVVGSDGVLELNYQAQSLHLRLASDRFHSVSLSPVFAEPLKREWEAFFRGEGSDGMSAMSIAEQMVERPDLRLAA